MFYILMLPAAIIFLLLGISVLVDKMLGKNEKDPCQRIHR